MSIVTMTPRRWLATAAVAVLVGTGVPAVWAVTDGPMRRALENNFFGESLIRYALYPRDRHDVYSQRKLTTVEGLPRVAQPIVYEPDVTTWNLAIKKRNEEETARLAAMAPPPGPIGAPTAQPMALGMPTMVPPAAGGIQLTPMGPSLGAPVGQPAVVPELPADANSRMANLLARARNRQIDQGSVSRIDQLKQRLVNHMQTMQQPPARANTPTAPDMVPVLPGRQPKGKPGYSYDQNY